MPDQERTPEFVSPGELDQPIGWGLSNPDRLEWLRTLKYEDYRLDLWNTGEHREGKPQLAYRLSGGLPGQGGQVWVIAFAGEEFFSGIGVDLYSDQIPADVLGFLALKPGDTDEDYFSDYTRWQIVFAERFSDDLSVWSSLLESAEECPRCDSLNTHFSSLTREGRSHYCDDCEQFFQVIGD